MGRKYVLPQGFFVTGEEMLDAGLRVHETMTGYRFVAETVEQVCERTTLVKNRIERLEIEGKCAENEGDTKLAASLRQDREDAIRVLNIWRARWRAMESDQQERERVAAAAREDEDQRLMENA